MIRARICLALASALEAVERVGSRTACKMFGLYTWEDMADQVALTREATDLRVSTVVRQEAAHRAQIAALNDRTNTLAEKLRAAHATLDQVDPFRLLRTTMGL